METFFNFVVKLNCWTSQTNQSIGQEDFLFVALMLLVKPKKTKTSVDVRLQTESIESIVWLIKALCTTEKFVQRASLNKKKLQVN